MKKREYEKPQIMEKMSLEEVLMDEELAPEWVNWKQSWDNWKNWNNSWRNNGVVPQSPREPVKGGEEG